MHSGQLGVHTTGHGKADELLALHEAADPDLFIPVHGEYAHLVAHHDLALGRGMPEGQVMRCTDGDRVSLKDAGLVRAGRVSDEYVICLLYTSDAADDTPCVDLGGRRII